MSENGWDVVVGVIIAPFGLKGEVKILPQTDFPERFQELKEVCVSKDDGPGRVLEIRSVRFHKGIARVKLAGINDISAAELLRGWEVRIRESDMAHLGEGEYYIDDIIGIDVVTTEGKDLGKIQEVLRSPANDVYITDRAMIPAVKEFVVSIDLDRKKMIVNPVAGLEQE